MTEKNYADRMGVVKLPPQQASEIILDYCRGSKPVEDTEFDDLLRQLDSME